MLVQERLLTELSLVMKGTPEYTDDVPAPFVPKKSTIIPQMTTIDIKCGKYVTV